MSGIVKHFGDLTACDNVDFKVEAGEVHALLGENGAGKTTLMNILYGLALPDAGEIEVSGSSVSLGGPGDAIDAGIGMVHQHPLLVDRLSVVENLFLGGVGDGTELGLREAISEVEERIALDVDPAAIVEDLPMSQRQRIEIIRCLARGVKVLILDEPTAVLTPDEVQRLFAEMERLIDGGHSVIFITHKLPEACRIATRTTVLRHGRLVGVYRTSEMTAEDLAKAMVGESVPYASNRARTKPGRPRLSLRGCSTGDSSSTTQLDNVSLEISEGEIVGIAGVEGNGQRQLSELTFGLGQPSSGDIQLDGMTLPPLGRWGSEDIQIGRIPEDRRHQGLTLNAPIWENMLTGPQAPKTGRLIRKRHTIDWTRRMLEEFGVRPPDPIARAEELSGGNQQKVVIARELWSNPGVVVAVNPTRGLDLRAQREIHDRLIRMRGEGVAILVISTDLDEVIAISDRIGVLYRGRLAGPIPAEMVDRGRVGMMMAGIGSDEPGSAVSEQVR